MRLPEEIMLIVRGCAPLFSDRVWWHAQILLVGALLAPGQRTVTAALRVMGLAQEKRFTTYHRVLNRAVWDARQGSRILLGLIVLWLVPSDSPVIVGADDTIERRKGKKIRAKGCYRDAVRSSHKHVVRCFGLKWVSMMVLVAVPWSARVWALPFLTVLCWPKDSPSQRQHKSSVDWVRQMIKQVRRWLPARQLVLVLDGSFAVVELALACVGAQVVMVMRLRWDAALYHWPEPQPPGKRGRKPSKGHRQRRLKTWAARSDTPWEEVDVSWYGGQCKTLLIFSRTALWYRPGQRPVPMRFVLVRDPEGRLRDEVFGCTDLAATPQQIIQWVVMRWSVEVTFEETHTHLGMETQRRWSDQAIARTTPVLLALFSIVTLLTLRLSQDRPVPVESTAWYRKVEPTFSDWLALVRGHLWRARFFLNSAPHAEFIKFPRETLDHLINSLPLAA
jgi:hypothetical protein